MYYIYCVTAWSKGCNSPHKEYVVETPEGVESHLATFNREVWDDGVHALRETEAFASSEEAEEYLLDYYNN